MEYIPKIEIEVKQWEYVVFTIVECSISPITGSTTVQLLPWWPEGRQMVTLEVISFL